MKEISIEESKNIQLEIMQVVHDFCTANNIQYSMCAGTLIGAIRHKGFIPWDDDIDIFMLRDEYNRFISTFKDSSGVYILHSLENDNSYCYPYAKVEDARTVMYENVEGPKLGIAIDVFPVDNCCNTKEDSVRFIKKVSRYKLLYKGKLVRPGKNNSFFKKVAIVGVKMLVLGFSLRELAEKVSVVCQTQKSDSKYVATVVAGYGLGEIQLRTAFSEYLQLPFENHIFNAIKNYDFYLRNVYGDYMQMPPENQRHSPHTLIGMYWK